MEFLHISAIKSLNDLHTSDQGIQLIKKFEGYRDRSYFCTSNHRTIGYGHKIKENEVVDEPLTKELGEALLQEDIEQAEDCIRKYVKVHLMQSQYDALVSFIFNIGEGNFKSSTLLKKLNEGDFEGAYNEFPRWIFSNKKKITGLLRRREAEREVFKRTDT